jgi:predicted kinase
MLIVLVGPKGSGKSHIGRLLERAFGVRFLHVERLWMQYYAECERVGRPPDIAEGIGQIHPRIAEAILGDRHVCVETTGASQEILEGLLSLAPVHERIVVRVTAPLELCQERIALRDPSHQIPVPPDVVKRIFRMSLSAPAEADLTLENVGLSDSALIQHFRAVLR